MNAATPGLAMDKAPLIKGIDFSALDMRVSTERYSSPLFAARERENLWMRVWQIAGRADEIPEAGDWLVHELFDQSYVMVRQKDGSVKGFVNACRHRGNAFCEGRGRSARFTCPYHNWSYGLDGKCLSVAKPDYEGPVEEFVGAKEELGLIAVPTELFAGFLFFNPDPDCAPLADFLGEAGPQLAAYRLEEMVPVGLNVRETIAANWKTVLDAFLEGYHVQGVHPELIPFTDFSHERCGLFGWHAATTVPFGAPGEALAEGPASIEMVRALPIANFPGLADVIPRFEQLVAQYTRPDGAIDLPQGVTGRTLLQQAKRDTFTAKGLDVSALTDNQLSDYQFWVLFPNVYIQVGAGEATVIWMRPDPKGDPNRCFWQVTNIHWLPPEEREAAREPLLEVPAGEHFPYFLALEQDFQQLEAQQIGLRNRAMKSMALTRQEPKVAHYHAMIDRWVEGAGDHRG